MHAIGPKCEECNFSMLEYKFSFLTTPLLYSSSNSF
jgi:hypothetical protein